MLAPDIVFTIVFDRCRVRQRPAELAPVGNRIAAFGSARCGPIRIRVTLFS